MNTTVFYQFTTSYSERESHDLLWQLLKCAIAGDIGKLPRMERQNLLSFYEQLQQMLPAIYALERDEHTAFPNLPEGGHHG